MAEWGSVGHWCHHDVRKKLCKKGRGDQTRHPQRSPLQRFSPKKEGIVVTVGRRSAAGDRADAQHTPREDAEVCLKESGVETDTQFFRRLRRQERLRRASFL